MVLSQPWQGERQQECHKVDTSKITIARVLADEIRHHMQQYDVVAMQAIDRGEEIVTIVMIGTKLIQARVDSNYSKAWRPVIHLPSIRL